MMPPPPLSCGSPGRTVVAARRRAAAAAVAAAAATCCPSAAAGRSDRLPVADSRRGGDGPSLTGQAGAVLFARRWLGSWDVVRSSRTTRYSHVVRYGRLDSLLDAASHGPDGGTAGLKRHISITMEFASQTISPVPDISRYALEEIEGIRWDAGTSEIESESLAPVASAA